MVKSLKDAVRNGSVIATWDALHSDTVTIHEVLEALTYVRRSREKIHPMLMSSLIRLIYVSSEVERAELLNSNFLHSDDKTRVVNFWFDAKIRAVKHRCPCEGTDVEQPLSEVVEQLPKEEEQPSNCVMY